MSEKITIEEASDRLELIKSLMDDLNDLPKLMRTFGKSELEIKIHWLNRVREISVGQL